MVWGHIKRGAKATGRGIKRGYDWLGNELDRTNTGFKEVDPTGQLGQLGELGVEGFQQRGQQMGDLAEMLQRRAQGEDSLSQEQLRQNLGRAMSQQQSFAAGASPANQAMAARTAANNMGQQAMGLSGQQALAGIQERAAAQNALGNMLMQQRQQDLGAAQGSLGTIEGARTARHQIGAQQPTKLESVLGLAQGVGSMAASASGGGGSSMTSDREAKTGIRPGDDAARQLVEALQPQQFRYRDPAADGEGQRLGIMAQDLEESDLGRALVQESGDKKTIDVPALASALAAAVGHLGERVERVEGSRDHPAVAQGERESRGRDHPSVRQQRAQPGRMEQLGRGIGGVMGLVGETQVPRGSRRHAPTSRDARTGSETRTATTAFGGQPRRTVTPEDLAAALMGRR